MILKATNTDITCFFFFRFSSICYLEHCPHLESSVDSRTYLPGAPLAVELVSAGGKLGSVV